MRMPTLLAVLLCLVLGAAGPACAERLIIPDETAALPAALYADRFDQPWAPRHPQPTLVERPIAEVIAMKLGLVQGSAQLFRFRLENAPSKATILRGEINGGGVRLRLTW